MEARLQRRVQRYGWDKAAPVYERHWAEQLLPAQRLLLEMAALRPGERVLDVACGTGLVTFPAAEAVGASGAVVATDISDAMVTHIREEAARRGQAHVSAHRLDAEALDLPDASFDVAQCALENESTNSVIGRGKNRPHAGALPSAVTIICISGLERTGITPMKPRSVVDRASASGVAAPVFTKPPASGQYSRVKERRMSIPPGDGF